MASQLIGPSAASSLVDALALLLLATGFLTVAARRLVLLIWTLALQSSLLVLVAATVAASSGAAHVWAMVACTLVIKALIIPAVLLYVLRTIKVRREVASMLSVQASLMIATALMLVAFATVGTLD